MSKKEFRVPVFKHTRHDIVQATYGALSEDAALFAAEEMRGSKAERIKKIIARLLEENKSTPNRDSIILSAACEASTTIEELILNCFELGKVTEALKNPLTMLKLLQTKRQEEQ